MFELSLKLFSNLKLYFTDTETPSIICPDDLFEIASNSDSAIVTWHDPTVGDNSGITPVFNPPPSHHSGDVFPEGTTIVTISVSDNANNINRCSFKVIVKRTYKLSDLDPVRKIGFVVSFLTVFVFGLPDQGMILLLVRSSPKTNCHSFQSRFSQLIYDPEV